MFEINSGVKCHKYLVCLIPSERNLMFWVPFSVGILLFVNCCSQCKCCFSGGNLPPAKNTRWSVPRYFTLSSPSQHECLCSLRSNVLCIGRVKKIGKWKSATERLGGAMEADALHTCRERWFSEQGRPVCQNKFLCAVAARNLAASGF